MLPSLFISHGSPMLALQPGASGPALQRLAAQITRPKAIVVVSAHWESHELLVSGSAAPETWHDFGSFPRELFAVQYPAPGDPQLAGEIVERLHADGLAARIDDKTPFRPRRLGAAVADVPRGGYPGGPGFPAQPNGPCPANPSRTRLGGAA